MNIDAAKTAIALVPKIEQLTALIAGIDLAISEGWRLSRMVVWAPEGSVQALHYELDLLPFGEASADMSALALGQAKQFYQAQLAALQAQLDAL